MNIRRSRPRILTCLTIILTLACGSASWSQLPQPRLESKAPAQQGGEAAEGNQLVQQFRNSEDLAQSAFASGDDHAALAALKNALGLGEQMIRISRHTATDSSMHALIRRLDVDGDLVFTLVAKHPDDPEAVRLGLAYATERKARFTREEFRAFGDWKLSVAHEQPALWQQLREAQDRLTEVSVAPAYVGGFHRDRIEQQQEVVEDLEGRIFEQGGIRREFSMGTSSDIFSDMGTDQLIAGVNFGRVLIVYVSYDEIVRTSDTVQLRRGASQYLAIVGHASAPLRAVPLGGAAKIDGLAESFLISVRKPAGDAAFVGHAAADLYRQIIAPITPYFHYDGIDYSQTLLISPDGALLTIPFVALLDGDTFLADQYRLEILDTPLDATIVPRTNIARSTSFVALANPAVAHQLAATLHPLAEADEEVTEIARLWTSAQQTVSRHSDATAEALRRSASGAGILHIASHGLFAANLLGNVKENDIRPESASPDTTGMMASSLVRSAIVLTPSNEAGDLGLFSALDVLSLDLSHTQLVVLSACDTGRGDRERGEGIYGLRQAFLQAGAETVVSSLWSVDSAATRELMITFYRYMFQGRPRGEALQRAEAATRLKYKHPYYWAGFVIVGNLGGLQLPDGP